MSKSHSLSAQWQRIVKKIQDPQPMRPGSICMQNVKYQARDGSTKTHGPYPIITSKLDGKTQTQRLGSDEKVQTCQRHIENFRRFKQLTGQLVRIGRQMAEIELTAAGEVKKNSSKRSGPSKRPKRRASSAR